MEQPVQPIPDQPSTFQGWIRRRDYQAEFHKLGYFVNKHLQEFIYDAVKTYVGKGDTIADIGCGEQPLKSLVEAKEAQYLGLDVIQNAQNNVDVVCSAESIPLSDQSINVILCTDVMEHIPDIDKAFSEFSRILQPGGYLILTVPFLWFLHEEPHDYRRPTPHLIQYLSNKHGLQVKVLNKTGNEIEAICCILDSLLALYMFDNKAVQFVWNSVRIFPRIILNIITAILSGLFGRALKQKYYLHNTAVLQKLS